MGIKCAIGIVASLVCVATSAWGFTGGMSENKVIDNSPPPHIPPVLGNIKGVVPWATLADVLTVKQKDRLVPKFSDSINALDKARVRVQGFMVPLEVGENQKHFILSATSPSCGFCLPSGPDAMVEVRAKRSFKYSPDPVIASGKFVLTFDETDGLYYRLVDAEPSAQ